MNHYLRAALATVVIAIAPAAAVAAHETPLAKVASTLGFAYSYLGPEDAVALSRAGVTVVIRPGERLFDVNDRTEAMEGAAPRFSHSDVFVSDALVARLRQIASFYPVTMAAEPPEVARQTPRSGTMSTSGAISALSVSQVSGLAEVAVSGKAPPNLPITITLVSTFSIEVPDVVLSRHEVTADADGSFKANISIAPGYFRGSILTLVATSLPGISSAKSQLVLQAPNGTVSIPADQIPSSIR